MVPMERYGTVESLPGVLEELETEFEGTPKVPSYSSLIKLGLIHMFLQ